MMVVINRKLYIRRTAVFGKVMRIVACVMAVTLIVGGSVAAQQRITIADKAACAACRIVLDRTVELAAPPAGMPGIPADVNVDGAGRIHLAFGPPSEYMLFSPTGQFVRGWERAGEGPGEFRMLRNILVTRGDSLLLFDPMLQRASVLSPDGRFVRSFRAPSGLGNPVETADGRFVLNEVVGQADRIGYPFHELSRQGVMGRSFGTKQGNLRPTEHWRMRFFTTRASGSRPDEVWVFRENGSYSVELWGVGERTPRRVIDRDAPWYPPFPATGVVRPSADRPPQSRVVGFWQDDAGLLWVVLRVPDPRWRTAIAAAPQSGRRDGTGEAIAPRITNPAHYTDTRIEVIDPVRGTLVAFQQFDRSLWGGTGRGVLLGRAADSDPYDPTWVVVMPRLVGAGER